MRGGDKLLMNNNTISSINSCILAAIHMVCLSFVLVSCSPIELELPLNQQGTKRLAESTENQESVKLMIH